MKTKTRKRKKPEKLKFELKGAPGIDARDVAKFITVAPLPVLMQFGMLLDTMVRFRKAGIVFTSEVLDETIAKAVKRADDDLKKRAEKRWKTSE